MRSYIKIYGPPMVKAIKALEKIAIDVPEVCIMDTFIESYMPFFDSRDRVIGYFSGLGEIPVQRCDKIISRSGEMVGENDFYFEWFKEPSMAELNNLMEKIDEALAPLGCKYTITTRR